MRNIGDNVLQWLVGDCQLFGLTGQNWMLLVGSGLLFYIAGMVIVRRRQSDLR